MKTLNKLGIRVFGKYCETPLCFPSNAAGGKFVRLLNSIGLDTGVVMRNVYTKEELANLPTLLGFPILECDDLLPPRDGESIVFGGPLIF